MNVVFFFEISMHFTRKKVRQPTAFIFLWFFSSVELEKEISNSNISFSPLHFVSATVQFLFVKQKAIVEKIGDRDHRINFQVISAGSWSSGYVVMVTAYRPQCWYNCTKVLLWIWTAFCPVLLRLKPEESWKLVYIVGTTLKEYHQRKRVG